MNEQAPIFEKPVNDYLRIATTSPEVAVADVAANIASITEAYTVAKAQQAELVVTPELSITAYSAADLFQNQHIIEQTTRGLQALAEVTTDGPALFVGAPLQHRGVLYNCAVMLAEGKIAGVIPKTYMANYKEFYEERWFTSGEGVEGKTIKVGEQKVPFGTDLLFDINDTLVGAEICEDLFAANKPGTAAALAGAQLVTNLSASNELIGKAGYRKTLISAASGCAVAGYVYCSAGRGESVDNVVYSGHQIVGEVGRIAAERKPFATNQTPLIYDFDRTYVDHDRRVSQTYTKEAAKQQTAQDYRVVELTVPQPTDGELQRLVDPLPYVPSNPETRNERCEEIFADLSHGLAQRLTEAHAESVVIGLSGGLDSTLSLLVALEATRKLDKPASFVHTVTMPGMASSERTQDNAGLLAAAVNTTHATMPINELSQAALRSIGHDGVTEDIAYENTQARMRTLLLMNYANKTGGFVQGTGDMSEAMIGWCTFNGDHMSMFNPSAGVPKTLVKHLVRWYAENRADDETKTILLDILDTPISPELTGDGDLSQTTEDIVGPFELTDFFTHELLRNGSRPSKIGYLASQAFKGEYDEQTIDYRLQQFLGRFTASQMKRNAAPDGLKIGSEAVSQTGDLRLPSNMSRNWWHEALAA